MTLTTMKQSSIDALRLTPTVLELVESSKIKPEGALDEEIISLDSWEYTVDFIVLQPRSTNEGHLVILGRPWLDTADAFIGCRSGNMFISRGDSIKQITLYPPTKSVTNL